MLPFPALAPYGSRLARDEPSHGIRSLNFRDIEIVRQGRLDFSIAPARRTTSDITQRHRQRQDRYAGGLSGRPRVFCLTSFCSFQVHPSTKQLPHNRKYVARVCLVLASAHLRQGRPRLVSSSLGEEQEILAAESVRDRSEGSKTGGFARHGKGARTWTDWTFTAASARTRPVSSASTASTSAVSASVRSPPTLASPRYGISQYSTHGSSTER